MVASAEIEIGSARAPRDHEDQVGAVVAVTVR